MRHVVDEGGTGADVLRRIGVVGVLHDIGGYRDMVDVEATRDALDRAFDGRRYVRRVVGDQHLVDYLRKSVRPAHDVAVLISQYQRHTDDIVVG